MKKCLLLIVVIQIVSGGYVFARDEKAYKQSLLNEYTKQGGRRLDYAKVLLFDPNYGERSNVAWDLCGCQPVSGEDTLLDPPVIPLLVYALENDSSPDVRESIAFNIWRFGRDPSVIVAVRKTLDDTDEKVKLAAAKSLLSLREKDTHALDILLNALDDPKDPEVQLDIAGWLQDSFQFKNAALLAALVRQPRASHRMNIAEILYRSNSDNLTFENIYCNSLLDIIKVIPRDDNSVILQHAIGSVSNLIQEHPQRYMGNELVLHSLREAIRIREEDTSKYAKWFLDDIKKLLNKIEK